MKSWLEAATGALTADQRAIVEGYSTKPKAKNHCIPDPHDLLQFDTTQKRAVGREFKAICANFQPICGPGIGDASRAAQFSCR